MPVVLDAGAAVLVAVVFLVPALLFLLAGAALGTEGSDTAALVAPQVELGMVMGSAGMGAQQVEQEQYNTWQYCATIFSCFICNCKQTIIVLSLLSLSQTFCHLLSLPWHLQVQH